jgi:hypothetical protein
MGASADPGSVEQDWLGAPMYFSGFSVEEGQHFIEMSGLAVVRLQTETLMEDQGPVAFTWVVAQKPKPIAIARR